MRRIAQDGGVREVMVQMQLSCHTTVNAAFLDSKLLLLTKPDWAGCAVASTGGAWHNHSA